MRQAKPQELYDLCDAGEHPARRPSWAWFSAFVGLLALSAVSPRTAVLAGLVLVMALAFARRYRAATRECPWVATRRRALADGGTLIEPALAERKTALGRPAVLDGGSLEHQVPSKRRGTALKGGAAQPQQQDRRHGERSQSREDMTRANANPA